MTLVMFIFNAVNNIDLSKICYSEKFSVHSDHLGHAVTQLV